MAGRLGNLLKENKMEKRCWNCEHAKEVECDPSMKEWMKDFVSCTKDGISIKCNKMYVCWEHKPNVNITVTAPTTELRDKWNTFTTKEK